MKAEIDGGPDFGHVVFQLGAGEHVLAESGAMAWSSDELDVEATVMGGWGPAIMRKVLAGESLLVGDYKARSPCELALSPNLPGQVVHHALADGPLLVQPGSFLACTPGVHLGTKFGGLRGFLSGEGLFFLDLQGSGEAWLNAYGAVLERQVDGELVIDTGHVVAWDPKLEWEIAGMGGVFNTLFSGEGLVMKFRGRGKILLQTRNVNGTAGWLAGYCRG